MSVPQAVHDTPRDRAGQRPQLPPRLARKRSGGLPDTFLAACPETCPAAWPKRPGGGAGNFSAALPKPARAFRRFFSTDTLTTTLRPIAPTLRGGPSGQRSISRHAPGRSGTTDHNSGSGSNSGQKQAVSGNRPRGRTGTLDKPSHAADRRGPTAAGCSVLWCNVKSFDAQLLNAAVPADFGCYRRALTSENHACRPSLPASIVSQRPTTAFGDGARSP